MIFAPCQHGAAPGSAPDGARRRWQGSKPVQITVELGLLAKADRLGRRRGLSRSELIGSGLRVMLTARARGRLASV